VPTSVTFGTHFAALKTSRANKEL